MDIFRLLWIASVPVIKVLLVTGVGAFLATKNIDVLGAEARKHLNRVVFYVFNPALVATNLSKTITFESVILLWFMPLNILMTFVIGIFFGWILVKITNAPTHLRGLILGCCSAGNLGNILLIIIPALCHQNGSPFGDSNVCERYGLAYVSLSMALGAIFLWSIVYNIMQVYARQSLDKEQPINTIDKLNPALRFSVENQLTVPEDSMEALIPSSKGPVLPSKIEDRAEKQNASERLKIEEATLVNFQGGIFLIESSTTISMKLRSGLKVFYVKLHLQRLFAPSTVGVVVGFILGVIPQLRQLMINESGPLHVIQDSAELVGEGAIPAVTLIMGGNLIKGAHPSGLQKSVILGVVFVRYLLMPIFGTFIVKGAIYLGLVHTDPLYQFILLIQYAVPPAMNIGTITQLFGFGENECSVIMLWTYALASISITLWSAFFMWLVA